VLRRLWTEQTVTFSGTFDQITAAGLAPMPVQRPIPVWVGAQSPPGYRRGAGLTTVDDHLAALATAAEAAKTING
jgi:alkanesulfonate monooxygenase SsuD/methylene tetrahydromethanopterin reductase-like flavin-dependent oxidoreductase (luciferase family)